MVDLNPNLSAYHRFRTLLLASVILVYFLILMGGIVRVTEAGGACPDWPTCLGSWSVPVGGLVSAAWWDYLHRFITITSVIPVIMSEVYAEKQFRRMSWIVWPLRTALLVLLGQVGLGALFTWVGDATFRSWNSALHTGLALIIEGLLLIPAVLSFYKFKNDDVEQRFTYQSPFSRLSLITLGVLFFVLSSGVIVARLDSTGACSGWPFCSPTSLSGWLNLGHRLLVGLSGILLTDLLIQSWRTQRSQTPILVSSTAAAVLFFAQALLGSRLGSNPPLYLLVLHQATATAVWAALVVQVITTGAANRTTEDERAETRALIGRKGLARDLFMLTKPVVVALLLVTTFTGMVIGARSWPSASLAFWTLLGGFMAAGGSGAINQYIDRFDDQKMQRTQKRPLPAGRLTPAEGLAFGVGIALASFYLLLAFVNLLAALLSLAGIIYYVLIYSLFLKKTTVQNIVIGGGAGAIPPLVGWAAATGSLNIPSLFLFAVIFMWTPPHFWALALVRRNDYARAGVPMLPVICGEKETRRQILVYTIELVVLTLILPVFGLGGSIYMVGAVLSGVWLLYAAWKVWRQEGNKVAWMMYRYSSMYLAVLFIVLMVDRLL